LQHDRHKKKESLAAAFLKLNLAALKQQTKLSRSLKLDRHLERREPRCRSIVGSVVSVKWT
jgi:hypothetical protein